MNNKDKIKRIVFTAILASLIIVLQTMFGSVKIGPVSISFVLVPIVFGALYLGPLYGLGLGLLGGIIVTINGLTGQDPFTYTLIEASPFWTIAIILLKGAASGFVPGIVYKAMKKSKLSVYIACALAPVVNTGIFCLCSLWLLYDPLLAMCGDASVFYFLFVLCAGWNFLAELGTNLVLSSGIFRAIQAIENRK